MNRDEYPMLAAAAPPSDDDDDPPIDAQQLEAQRDLDAVCVAWAVWCHTRRLYVRPSVPPSVLGRLQKRSGRPSNGGPDAANSAELAAFHIGFLAQPEDALDRRVFELHYYHRVRNVKAAADAMGVSRQHWYRLVASCRERIYATSRQLLQKNLDAAQALPSRLIQCI